MTTHAPDPRPSHEADPRCAGRCPTSRRAEPGDGPALEFEGLVKLIFADHGTRDAALASIARARDWAVEQNAGNIEAGERFVAASEGRYGERRAGPLVRGRLTLLGC